MGRIDQAAARRRLEGELQHIELGRVDHQRDIHSHFELLDDPAHQFDFVRSFGDCAGDIQRVGATRNLFTGKFQNPVVILLQQHFLESARALRIAALAEEGRRRILVHQGRSHGGGELGICQVRTLRMRSSVELLNQQFQMLGCRPAASAHH